MDDGTMARRDCRECSQLSAEKLMALGVTADDEGIGRRTFLVQSGILAAVAALAGCGLGGNDVTSPSIPSGTTVAVANYPSLANVGGVAMLTIGSAPLAIVRTGSSSFLALSRVCPHQGGIVQLQSSVFVCPQHGATFNTSGQWIGGQRTSSLHSYSTSYDAASGTLTIS